MPTKTIIENKAFSRKQVKRIIWLRLAIVLWFSFLLTCVQSLFFFAIFDPLELIQLVEPQLAFNRIQGYTFLFLFFWLFSFLTGLFCGVIMVFPRKILAKTRRG